MSLFSFVNDDNRIKVLLLDDSQKVEMFLLSLLLSLFLFIPNKIIVEMEKTQNDILRYSRNKILNNDDRQRWNEMNKDDKLRINYSRLHKARLQLTILLNN